MIFEEYANEIKEKINSNQTYKKRLGEKSGCIYLFFYENGQSSVIYKMSPDVWEKVNQIINNNNGQ